MPHDLVKEMAERERDKIDALEKDKAKKTD
jgi:hypothetical protein